MATFYINRNIEDAAAITVRDVSVFKNEGPFVTFYDQDPRESRFKFGMKAEAVFTIERED